MSITRIILIIAIFAIFSILLLVVSFQNQFINIDLEWVTGLLIILLIAILLSFLLGFSIEYVYRRLSYHSRFSKTTRFKKPRKIKAKLVLSVNKKIFIGYYERVYGREDFLGILLIDELSFIGKEHFRITHLDDGFYIEDMDTKNGTRVNGKEIKGQGMIKLKNKDSITVARVMNARYLEENVD